MTILTLLRHGRTVANAAGLLQGHADNPLDDEGHRQAVAAAAMLGPVDMVITSPLLRARETAAHLGGEAVIDERWIELDYGDWDSRPLADIPADTWTRWRTDIDLRPPGGETLNEVGVRTRDALEELAGTNKLPGHVVVVSHVSPIKAAVAWALATDDLVSWRMRLTTGSYSQISLAGPTPSLASFNVIPAVRSAL